METPDQETEVVSNVITAGTTYGDAGEDGKKPRIEASVTFNAGEDLTSAVELYGEDVVYERYRRGVDKDCGNAIRSALNKHLDAGKDPAEIPGIVEAELENWRPDVTRRVSVKKDPTAAFLAGFADMDADKRAEILAQLTALTG